MNANAVEQMQPTAAVKTRLIAKLRSRKVFSALVAMMAMVSGSVLVLTVASAPRANATSPGWAIQTTPNPDSTSTSVLAAVSCPSTTACLAVGYNMPPTNPFSPGYSAFAEFWDGTTWKIVPPVQPSGTVSELSAVSCTSATDCMAVGDYKNSSGTMLPLAEQWIGASWIVRGGPPAAPAGSTSTELTGVSCPSIHACMAVGDWRNGTTNSVQDLAEIWYDARSPMFPPRWTIEPTQGTFSEVNYHAERGVMLTDNHRVHSGRLPGCRQLRVALLLYSQQLLHLVRALERRQLVGRASRLPQQQLQQSLRGVMQLPDRVHRRRHLNRQQRHELPLSRGLERHDLDPQFPKFPVSAAGTALGGVSCTSATVCTAVGWAFPPYGNKPYQTVALAESWDGTSWTLGSPLNPLSATQTALLAVSCPATAVCTAVGRWGSWTPANNNPQMFPLAERYS